MSKPWSLSDLHRLREEMEMQARLHAIEHEHKMRRVLGDDVYEFMRGENPFWIKFDPDAFGPDSFGPPEAGGSNP